MKPKSATFRRTAPVSAAVAGLALVLSGCSTTAGAAVDPSCTPKHESSWSPPAP